jgi:hypothetical protein
MDKAARNAFILTYAGMAAGVTADGEEKGKGRPIRLDVPSYTAAAPLPRSAKELKAEAYPDSDCPANWYLFGWPYPLFTVIGPIPVAAFDGEAFSAAASG